MTSAEKLEASVHAWDGFPGEQSLPVRVMIFAVFRWQTPRFAVGRDSTMFRAEVMHSIVSREPEFYPVSYCCHEKTVIENGCKVYLAYGTKSVRTALAVLTTAPASLLSVRLPDVNCDTVTVPVGALAPVNVRVC